MSKGTHQGAGRIDLPPLGWAAARADLNCGAVSDAAVEWTRSVYGGRKPTNKPAEEQAQRRTCVQTHYTICTCRSRTGSAVLNEAVCL